MPAGNGLVLVAEPASHRQLEGTRRYSLPSATDSSRISREAGAPVPVRNRADPTREPPDGNSDPVVAARLLPPLVRVFLVSFLAVEAIAYAADGLGALTAWATVGTAVGTLGLAFFTLTLARQTAQAIAASQRIERISLEQLKISSGSLDAAGACQAR